MIAEDHSEYDKEKNPQRYCKNTKTKKVCQEVIRHLIVTLVENS
jgi:hypothetical protein